MYRIGQGFDIHRLEAGRKLVLGGIEPAYEKGLLGHSDADALLHAVIDALFGALALGDIGAHFPDTDMQYKDADSALLLKKAYEIIKEKGYAVNNIDCTIYAEKPKMQPYIPLMRQRMAEILEIDVQLISVKAKTMEGLGAIGSSEAIAASCTALLQA